MDKICVYTATSGGYAIKRTDIRCFVGDGMFKNGVMDAKRFKILSHLYCPDAEVTVYLDGNVWLLTDAQALADRYLGDDDMALFAHPYRKVVWDEFAALRADRRFNFPFLRRQLADQEAAYRDAGLPQDTPAYECNFLIRRNTEHVNCIMSAWWAEICRWQWRDQVSLPYVLWRYGEGLKLRAIAGQNIRAHPDFRHVEQH